MRSLRKKGSGHRKGAHARTHARTHAHTFVCTRTHTDMWVASAHAVHTANGTLQTAACARGAYHLWQRAHGVHIVVGTPSTAASAWGAQVCSTAQGARPARTTCAGHRRGQGPSIKPTLSASIR